MIIDAHVHCGAQDLAPPQDYEFIANLHRESGVDAAVMFAPVMEVYDRHDPAFEDNDAWRARRERANRYLLDLSRRDLRPKVYPFLFAWNDFRADQLDDGYVGVKWHRHADEPPYHYDSPGCAAMIDAIRERGLPVLIEEEFEHTMRFIERAPDIRICIPHIGHLNGGYERLEREGVWRRPHIFTDASPNGRLDDTRQYLSDHGPDRLMFGTDYPFGTPAKSAAAMQELDLSDADRQLVMADNALRFIGAGA